MKTLIFLCVSFLLSNKLYSCSCGPWDYDFYNNVTARNENGILRFDTSFMIVVDSTPLRYNRIARVTLIKGFNFSSISDGDTLLLFDDGFSCMIGLSIFNSGDTIIASLGKQDSMYYIPFLSYGGCGTHYLSITNGKNNELSIAQIEDKIRDIITSIEEANARTPIKIFPNPFSDFLTISYSDAEFDFILTNSQGQTIFQIEGNSHEATIDVNKLPRGNYMGTILVKQRRVKSLSLIKN